MKHINESIIGRRGSEEPGKLKPGDVVEYSFRATNWWRFIPKGYLKDKDWKDLDVTPPKNSNLLVAAYVHNGKVLYCNYVDLENIDRVDLLTGHRFGQVYRQNDPWEYKKPEDMIIYVRDLDNSTIIKED